MSRQSTLSAIKQNPQVSVLIIGGGINGIGTFRDLALQGVDVLLVEMNDFCSGASAASSHMVHGGLRYLENGEFRLVREALTERNRLLQNAPHYVKPLPTTIPIFNRLSGMLNAPLKFLNLRDKPSQRGLFVIRIGLTFYDLFTRGQQTLPTHKVFSKAESLKARPDLNPDIINTAQYYDAWMPYPERIALELVMDGEAEHDGARALNYVKAVGADKNSVILQDTVTGEEFSVEPQIVINAAGPWIDFANEKLNRSSQFIGGTKGSHIVVHHPQLYQACLGNEMFFESQDGRITLILPLQENRVIIGTTDIAIDNPDDAECTDEEIDYMLDLVPIVFPNLQVERKHILFHFTGVRPLPSSDANTTGQISRDHSIRVIEEGVRGKYAVLSLIGGKWTTYRAFSEQAADKVMQRLGITRKADTKTTKIGGGKNYPVDNRESWLNQQQAETGYTRERLETLLNRYGGRALDVIAFCQAEPDTPLTGKADFTAREVIFLAQNEHLIHLDDLFLRRTLLAMLGKLDRQTITEIAGYVGGALGWSDAQTQQEIERSITILQTKNGMTL